MTVSLQRMIRRLERQKAELIRRIEEWPRDWLDYKPVPSCWSALEVLDHLRKTEPAVLESCEQNLKSRKYSVTRSERVQAALFLAMMRLPIKLKVPEPVSFVRPDHSTYLQTVLDLWSAERRLLRTFFNARTSGDGDMGVVFHPAAGWLDLRGALSFLSVHLRHHEYQLQRIKKACAKSGAQRTAP